MIKTFATFLLGIIGSLQLCPEKFAAAQQWNIPLAGNTFRTLPEAGQGTNRDGILSWRSKDEEYVVFFHVSQAASLDLILAGEIPAGSKIECSWTGSSEFNSIVGSSDSIDGSIPIGSLAVRSAGYVGLKLRGLERESQNPFAKLRELVVKCNSKEVTLHYVRNNEGNMFYWGRRGPSVHLTYAVPKDVQLQYAYSELKVPVGSDPIGSYFMANGFSEGYFGMQVNSPTERRILFSVWSPFQTDNPKEIPEDQRIELLAKGETTHVGQFGNEGSGGQSYVIYPWRSGTTVRFLTEVKPIDDNNTRYTCWFAAEKNSWQLVASFRRPKSKTNLKGFHSFLENFDPTRGHVERKCLYGNVWVADVAGRWHSISQAKFSVDPTGGGRHRLDYEGGVEGEAFFLRNCGFFSGQVAAGERFKLPANSGIAPLVDFDQLPR